MTEEPDYKMMYLTMFDASEKAIELLIAAQQECEKRTFPLRGQTFI